VVIPNVLTDGVPEGCLGGFWHFWHCLTLGMMEVGFHARRRSGPLQRAALAAVPLHTHQFEQPS
jgi:hypothetical protein